MLFKVKVCPISSNIALTSPKTSLIVFPCLAAIYIRQAVKTQQQTLRGEGVERCIVTSHRWVECVVTVNSVTVDITKL
jgi:hypothetical protein